MRLHVFLLFGLALTGFATEKRPEVLLADERELASPMELKLATSRTSTVFRAQEGEWQFNLHSYIAWHDGRFWAIWSSGRVDEDSPSQLIRYATSRDGHTWTKSGVLADDPDGPEQPGRWIARGVSVMDGKLVALLARFDGPGASGERKESWSNLRLVRFEWTGKEWQDTGVLVDNCMNNYPPRWLGGGYFMTCRDSFATMHVASSDAAGRRWDVRRLPGEPPNDRMSEPSWYVDPEGATHLIFRDGRGSGWLFRSISADQGKTWTAPVRTNYPDATSKNIAGRLSNGLYYLINNPRPKNRDPLAISFSKDGWTYGSPLALRKKAPEQRYKGRAKNPHSFQYPHTLERNGSLWVIYSTNKEDIEISEYPVAGFGLR